MGNVRSCFNPCFIGTYSFTKGLYDSLQQRYDVLILVLLELILLRIVIQFKQVQKMCFNPCFIGTYSFTTRFIYPPTLEYSCFNPCFIGTYSFTYNKEKLEGENGLF